MVVRKFIAKDKMEKIGERTYRVPITDETIDRYRTVITADGWDFESYMRNPIVLVQHDSWSDDLDSVVGVAHRLYQDDEKRTWAEFELEPEEINEKAAKLDKKLTWGSLRGVSVGFNPFEWERGQTSRGENPDVIYFRKQELLEFSVVKIPANPSATPNKEAPDYEEFVRMIRTDLKMDELSPIPEEKCNKISPDEHTGRLLKLRFNTL